MPESPIVMALNGVVSVLLAPPCAACDEILDTPLNGCVCRNCWEAIAPVDDIDFAEDAAMSRIISVGSYDGALRNIVHALKYQGRRSIARHLARLMRHRAQTVLAEADFVVAVPLHWRREYSRGFNQAREIARSLGPPVLEALTRSRATPPQVALSAPERQHNVANAFALKRSTWRTAPSIVACNVVLVDDVVTTGATLEACAAVLRGAGAGKVYGLTVARTI
jgi:ComF family protein